MPIFKNKADMKILALSPCLLFALVFLSCRNVDKALQAGEQAVKEGQLALAEETFREVMDAAPHEWEKGYAHLSGVLRELYIMGEMPRETFLAQFTSLYEQWYAHNGDDTKHLVPYGVVLFLSGEREAALSLMERFYRHDYAYNFGNPPPEDVFNCLAGLMTGRIQAAEFQGTVYSFLLDMSEEDMLNIFVGH